MEDKKKPQHYTPVRKIWVNGNPLRTEFDVSVKELAVEEEINLPAMFSFKINLIQPDDYSYQGIDLKVFKPGDEIKIEMGVDRRQELMRGEITALEVEFDEESSLEVRGYDLLHRLRFGTKRRSFKEVKDGDLVTKIASDHGLTAKAGTTTTTYEYLFQNNQTDYEFLLERAQRIGYEVMVAGKDLIFRPSQEGAAPVATLQNRLDVKRFFVQLKTLAVGSSVEVRGWDIRNKREIIGKAESGAETATMGRDSGVKVSEKILKSPIAYANQLVKDEKEAEVIAKAQYNSIIKEFIQGEGVCYGNPAIRAGKTIELKGFGGRFSGKYYVIAATHMITEKEGYLTKFKVKRTGI